MLCRLEVMNGSSGEGTQRFIPLHAYSGVSDSIVIKHTRQQHPQGAMADPLFTLTAAAGLVQVGKHRGRRTNATYIPAYSSVRPDSRPPPPRPPRAPAPRLGDTNGIRRHRANTYLWKGLGSGALEPLAVGVKSQTQDDESHARAQPPPCRPPVAGRPHRRQGIAVVRTQHSLDSTAS